MVFRWSDFVLDVPGRTLRGPEGPVHVEPQVFDVLTYLVEHRERVIPKAELLDSVWGDQFVSESALTTRIKNARRALGDDGKRQQFIRNVHGRGYQFVGDIDSNSGHHSAREAAAVSLPASRPIPLASAIGVDDEFTFVGREEELAEALARCHSTEGSIQLYVGGVPGSGKSRLALQLASSLAEDGWLASAGRCEPFVTSSLQAVRDSLSHLARTAPGDFVTWADGIEAELLGLMPGLVDLFPVEPVSVDAYAGVQVLLSVIDRIANERPVVLLIDDLHWSDELTRVFLARLHRQYAGRQIFTIATFRTAPVDLPAEVQRFVGDQVRSPNSLRLDLDRLDERAGRELVVAVLGEDRAGEASEVLERTEGHVLFLTETLRDLARGGASSGSVMEIVLSRLATLSDDAQRLVRIGAVVGPEFPFAVTVAAADLDPLAGLEAIDDAVAAELLHETASPDRFRFSHQLIPEAILDAMTGPTRAMAHHRCAASLEQQGADDVEVSFHLLSAVPLVAIDDALARARTAVAAALDRKQFDRAVRLLSRMLAAEIQTRQRAEILVQIGQAMVASGASEGGVPFFEDAAELARRNGWTDILVDAALGHFGQSPFRKPSDQRTLDLLAEADAALDLEPSVLRARILGKTAAFSLFSTSLADRTDMVDRALAMATDATVRERLELLEYGMIVFSCPAGIDRIEPFHHQVEVLREETDTYFSDAAAPETMLLAKARGPELRRVAEMDPARILAQPIAEWRDLVLRSTFLAFDGDTAVAHDLCDQAAAIGEPFWGESSHALHAFGHLFIAHLSGEWERAEVLFDVLRQVTGSELFRCPLALARAGMGDLDGAADVLAGAKATSFERLGEHIMGGNVLSAAAEVALLIDDDRIADLAQRHLAPFEHLMLGVPWACSLAAADPLSRLARRRGDQSEAERLAGIARRIYTDLGAPALAERFESVTAGMA